MWFRDFLIGVILKIRANEAHARPWGEGGSQGKFEKFLNILFLSPHHPMHPFQHPPLCRGVHGNSSLTYFVFWCFEKTTHKTNPQTDITLASALNECFCLLGLFKVGWFLYLYIQNETTRNTKVPHWAGLQRSDELAPMPANLPRRRVAISLMHGFHMADGNSWGNRISKSPEVSKCVSWPMEGNSSLWVDEPLPMHGAYTPRVDEPGAFSFL